MHLYAQQSPRVLLGLLTGVHLVEADIGERTRQQACEEPLVDERPRGGDESRREREEATQGERPRGVRGLLLKGGQKRHIEVMNTH